MNKHNLHIAEPCHARWSEMSGDSQKRFCSECDKHVHDLSAMTPQAAQALIAESTAGASLCVRYEQDNRGAIRFRAREVPATAPLAQQRGANLLLRGAASAASMLFALAAGAVSAGEQPTELSDPRPGPISDTVFMGMDDFVDGELGEVSEPCEGSGETPSDGSGSEPEPGETEVWMGESPETMPSIQGGLPAPDRLDTSTPKNAPKQVAPLATFEAKAAAILAQYGIVLEDTEIVAQIGDVEVDDVPCVKPTPVGPSIVSPPVLMGRMPVMRHR